MTLCTNFECYDMTIFSALRVSVCLKESKIRRFVIIITVSAPKTPPKPNFIGLQHIENQCLSCEIFKKKNLLEETHTIIFELSVLNDKYTILEFNFRIVLIRFRIQLNQYRFLNRQVYAEACAHISQQIYM